MTNAQKEILELLDKNNVKLESAVISIDIGYQESSQDFLKPNHTPAEWCQFMNAIDRNYNSGFGIQELSGVLWFTDGTWATRGEYDGSEWWEHHRKPSFDIMFNMYKK